MISRSRSLSFRIWFAPALLAVAAAATFAHAQDPPKTITQKIKEKTSNAVVSFKKGVGSANDAVRAKFESARNAVSAMNIEARVMARLHWEKALADTKLELHAPSEGVIDVIGVVADEKVKAKTLDLVRDTIGVTQVIDHLTTQTTTDGGVAPVKP